MIFIFMLQPITDKWPILKLSKLTNQTKIKLKIFTNDKYSYVVQYEKNKILRFIYLCMLIIWLYLELI